MFLLPSLNPQRISSPQAELITGELHGLTPRHPLESHIAPHFGPVIVSLVGLKTVAFPFLHFHSLLGVHVLGAEDSRKDIITQCCRCW